jgi:hypothetical protein
MRMLFASEFSDATAFAQRYREIFQSEEGDAPATDEEIEAFRLEMLEDLRDGSVGFADPHQVALSLGINVAGQQCYIIFGMSWTILRCPGGFVTSDRGLAVHDPTPPYPWSAQGLLSSPSSETTIPLSADTCLLVSLDERALDVRDISQSQADEINLRTYGWADGYVFGRSQQAVTELRRLARRRPADVIRPKPRHHTMLLEADPTDTTLADRNRARGWPPYILLRGVPHDYIVFRHGENPMDDAALSSKKIEERARRALGVAEGEPLPGGERIATLLHDEIGSGSGEAGAIQREWHEFLAWAEAQQAAAEEQQQVADS